MEEKYQEYLIDESKYSGYADSISFPKSEEDMIDIVMQMNQKNTGITIQGGKTGIVGGAVPKGGHIMNLSRMNACKDTRILEDGTALMTVEAGISLMDLNKEIIRIFKNNPMLWPPQPTEESATVGGIASTCARGINVFLYGDSRQYFDSVRLVLSDGTVRVIRRTDERALLDRVLGAEGIVGAFSELTLRLLPKPESIWGISFFFESKEDVGIFIEIINKKKVRAEDADIAAMEYLDKETIKLIESRKSVMTKIKEIPDVEPQFVCMIYFELQGREEGIESIAEQLMEIAMDCNCDPDKAWALSGEAEIEKMKAFRHAAAESVNLFIEEVRHNDKRITKLGTDMAISESDFKTLLAGYEDDLKTAALNSCVFGHIGENHLHVNILPKDFVQYQKGMELIKAWGKSVKEKGGKVVCEHGIGKLKKEIQADILSDEEISDLSEIKTELDAKKMWNRGNVL